MKKEYDIIYLTNTPSFYKINLCNEIAGCASVLLVFYGYGSEAVNKMLKSEDSYRFDYVFLFEGDASKRNRLKVFGRLCRLMSYIRYKKILYSGWLAPEYNLLSFFTPKKKNCLICESSVLESDFSGGKGWLKKQIIGRMAVALPSGELQKMIFEEIGYTGKIVMTGGVGIFNKIEKSELQGEDRKNKKYLYVGRLISCKNLNFLIDEFNKNGRWLTIVGKGELEQQLKAKAKENIHFVGFVENEKLGTVYQDHDVFILPSRSEVWGLVVEEAIYWGLPVVVSDRVGAYRDMVEKPKTGLVFELDNQDSFNNALKEIENNYSFYKKNADRFDFDKRDECQVNAYLPLIK